MRISSDPVVPFMSRRLKEASICASVIAVPVVLVGLYFGTGYQTLPKELTDFDTNQNSVIDHPEESSKVVSEFIDSNHDGYLNNQEVAVGMELIDKCTKPPVNKHRSIFHHTNSQNIFESRRNISDSMISRIRIQDSVGSSNSVK